MNGWIKLHRQIINWEWYGDIPTKNVFIHLLLTANHKAKGYCGMALPAGSVVTGRRKLARELGLTQKQVRRALDNLESTGEISRARASKFSIITLYNYFKYQVAENGAGPAEGQQSKNSENVMNSGSPGENDSIHYQFSGSAKGPAKGPAETQQQQGIETYLGPAEGPAKGPAEGQQRATKQECKERKKTTTAKKPAVSSFSSERKKAEKPSGRFDPHRIRPDWFPESDWKNLVAHRKSIGSTNSELSYKAVIKELEKAKDLGHSPDAIVHEMIARDWRGFKAEWMTPEKKDGSNGSITYV